MNDQKGRTDMKKSTAFRAIRARMTELDYTQRELAVRIKRSQSYVALRMEGKMSWNLDDMYRVMDALNIKKESMHEYFPRGGATA